MKDLRERYRVERRPKPFQALPEMSDAGLTLGRGTLLAPLGSERNGEASERMAVLLAAVYGRPVTPLVTKAFARAAGHWRRGDGALAHIELAFARLPRLESEDDAFRLFLAERLLAEAMTPRALARALGFEADLSKYAPDQPRVPAGSGRESGQWTSNILPPTSVLASNSQVTAIVIAAETTTPDGHILNDKTQKRMRARNVTPENIDEAVRSGSNIDAINKATGGPAIRYVNPTTNQSVVIDKVTNRVLHVGEPGFEYGPDGGDVPGATMRPGPAVPLHAFLLLSQHLQQSSKSQLSSQT